MTTSNGDDLDFVRRPPTIEEYRTLRRAVGWWDVDDAAAGRGLEAALFSICVLRDGDIIGCGRIVGDGGLYYYVQDIIVIPEYQGRGIGRRIMKEVMDFLEAEARPGAFLGLMAARGKGGFYDRYGFERRHPESPGMFRVWKDS
jgi:GNAT superfamily N-acetyltransferase